MSENIAEIVQACYEALASEYDNPEHASIQYNEHLEQPELLRMFGDTHPLRTANILDLGCGTGRMLWELYSMGYRDLTGLDLAGNMIKEARKKFDGVAYCPLLVQGNAEQIRSIFHSDRFDYVFASFCDHIPDQEKTFRGIYVTLKPGGTVILSYPDKELAEILRPQLLEVKVDETRFRVDSGQTYIVPSTVFHPHELEQLLISASFKDIEITKVKVGDRPHVQPTQYIQQVAEIIERPVAEIPVVMVAKAVKPYR